MFSKQWEQGLLWLAVNQVIASLVYTWLDIAFLLTHRNELSKLLWREIGNPKLRRC